MKLKFGKFPEEAHLSGLENFEMWDYAVRLRLHMTGGLEEHINRDEADLIGEVEQFWAAPAGSVPVPESMERAFASPDSDSEDDVDCGPPCNLPQALYKLRQDRGRTYVYLLQSLSRRIRDSLPITLTPETMLRPTSGRDNQCQPQPRDLYLYLKEMYGQSTRAREADLWARICSTRITEDEGPRPKLIDIQYAMSSLITAASEREMTLHDFGGMLAGYMGCMALPPLYGNIKTALLTHTPAAEQPPLAVDDLIGSAGEVYCSVRAVRETAMVMPRLSLSNGERRRNRRDNNKSKGKEKDLV